MVSGWEWFTWTRLTGTQINNLISYKEVYSSINKEYIHINSLYIDSISQDTGTYYMANFKDINIQFIEKFAYKRRDYIILNRIITNYSNTNKRLFKIGLIDSSACNCDFSPQELNHLFWACPLQRQKIYYSLKQLKLQEPFSIEYLLENIGKKIGKKKLLLLYANLFVK